MFKFKKYFAFVLFSSFIFLMSCAKEELEVVTTERSPFTGKYNFQFISGPSGSTPFDIDNSGAFDFSVNLRISGNTSSYNFKGEVKKNGIVNAIVKQDTTNFADMSGQFYNGVGSGYVTGGTIGLWKADYVY